MTRFLKYLILAFGSASIGCCTSHYSLTCCLVEDASHLRIILKATMLSFWLAIGVLNACRFVYGLFYKSSTCDQLYCIAGMFVGSIALCATKFFFAI